MPRIAPFSKLVEAKETVEDWQEMLGITPGTDVQAYSANLTTLSAPSTWKLFYSNGSSVVTELAFGASGTVLQSSGVSSAPTFATPTTFSVGMIMDYAGGTATVPSLWLLCYGQAISRTTYSALFAVLCPSATITVTIASPGVVSWTAHGLGAGDPVVFTTTGALPTGITAGTTYYVISAGLTADAFEISATIGGAAVNTSGSQSGVHTGRRNMYGFGDGTTTFNVPDLRGRVSAGQDDMGGTSANRLTGVTGSVDGDVLGRTGGEETHVLTTDEMPSHTHTVGLRKSTTASTIAVAMAGNNNTADATETTSSSGSDGAHNNVPPVIVLNKIIYTGV